MGGPEKLLFRVPGSRDYAFTTMWHYPSISAQMHVCCTGLVCTGLSSWCTLLFPGLLLTADLHGGLVLTGPLLPRPCFSGNARRSDADRVPPPC